MFQNTHFPKYLVPELIRKEKETGFCISKTLSYCNVDQYSLAKSPSAFSLIMHFSHVPNYL